MIDRSRRTFVLGLTGTASIAAGSASRGAAVDEKVRLAVVGARGMGSSHLRNLLKLPQADVRRLCDIDESVLANAAKTVVEAGRPAPKLDGDFRRVLDDPEIEAVVVATPHHWHAPIAIRAILAGKDVYVEKPASHVFREGRLLVDAAAKHRRIIQHGTQMRSSDVTAKAGELLKSGVIGEVKVSKAWNVQKHSHRRAVPDEPAPRGVDYDRWLGPAPSRPFNPNRFHGNWQWYRDYGNGDIGNDGIHDIDMSRFGLGVETHPVRVTAHGSKIALEGEREYPDNMNVSYQYEDGKVLIYEDRGFTPYGLHGVDSGNAFYGTEGYMIFSRRGYFQVYLGPKEEKGPSYRGGAGHPEHLIGFLESVRTRSRPTASAEVAHLSCALTHLGEVAYRTRTVLEFDPVKEVVTNSAEANALLSKEYRAPWGMPAVG